MAENAIWPRSFSFPRDIAAADPYLADPAAARLAAFFRAKGLAALKEEDSQERWYQDWLDYQAEHRLYASLLSPSGYSSLGFSFRLLRLTRFLEVFAYFSPSHGYSLQVTFLGLFSILMGSNDALKREAVAALEGGGLFALGVSEKEHGADLLAGEFSIAPSSAAPDDTAGAAMSFVANGTKYYIGNCNCASIISILAKKVSRPDAGRARRRGPQALLALRPGRAPGYTNVRKIRTSGVRAAFVGSFEVADHACPASDLIAEGRDAWDAVLGTVTLGKFFLGFGSIGICAHAMEEAVAHTRSRILYQRPVLEMPHIRLAMVQAYTRLLAMKLYAYRALDYLQAAGAAERRYILFCAVQKARVSTEGVRVMAQLSECVGARGFECQTYFESALRDIQLIPGLEGSAHINLLQTAQFAERYFERRGASVGGQAVQAAPASLMRGDAASVENPYLMQARSGSLQEIEFAHFLEAYRPLKQVGNVRRFARQAKTVQLLVRHLCATAASNAAVSAQRDPPAPDLRVTLALGQCVAIVAYGQLIAENASLLAIPSPIVAAMFHLLVSDLSAAGEALAALPELDARVRRLAQRLLIVPRTTESDWGAVYSRLGTLIDE